MSITLSDVTAQRLRRYALRERRPVSQVVEMAVEDMLTARAPATVGIVTTRGGFRGTFSREETYGGR